MSACPADSPGASWIDVATAAQRLTVTPERIRQLCRDEWQRQGFASRAGADAAGRPSWMIREDAHPSLARVQFPEFLPFDRRQLNGEHRDELNLRQQVYEGWERAKANAARMGMTERQATEQYLSRLEMETGEKIDRSTLYRWRREFRARGQRGLVDGRWQAERKEAIRESDPFFVELRRHYLNLKRHSKQVCYEVACCIVGEAGGAIPSYRTACRYLDSIPRPVVLKFRRGEKVYEAEGEPFIERRHDQPSNTMWVSDHSPIDVIVNVGTREAPQYGRATITAWMDDGSRKIVGWTIYATAPNTDTILRSFRSAVLSHGLPDSIYIDNGKDYDSAELSGISKIERQRIRITHDVDRIDGVFGGLQITVTHTWKYHGQSKLIERFFGTMEDRWARRFQTYCGCRTQDKPEDLAEQIKRGNAPLLAELVESFGRWLEQDYHASAHSGEGMNGATPADAWQARLTSKRTAPADLLEFLLLRKTKPIKVTQNGVNYKGVRYGQWEVELTIKRLGRMVILRVDDADLSKVTVCDLSDKFICIAQRNQRMSPVATSADLREAIARKRHHRKLLKEYHETRPHLHRNTDDLMNRAAIERRRKEAAEREPRPDSPPPTLRPLQSPLVEEMEAMRQATRRQELRKAAGAELMDFAAVFSTPAQDEPAEAAADMFEEFGRALRGGNL